MVTEPPLPELEAGLFKEEAVEDDALLEEEVVEVVKEAVELGEIPEVCLLLIRCPPEAETKPDDWSLVTMLDIELLEDKDDEAEDEDDFTGEMVTLLLLLSFLW